MAGALGLKRPRSIDDYHCHNLLLTCYVDAIYLSPLIVFEWLVIRTDYY